MRINLIFKDLRKQLKKNIKIERKRTVWEQNTLKIIVELGVMIVK